MKTVNCPECGSRVRPCNLTRHRRSHLPVPVDLGIYTYFLPGKRPMLQHNHDTRYDEVAPRGEGQYRARIYRLRGGELQLIAAAPGPMAVGVALFDLHERGEFIADDSVGVLDTGSDPGDWIVHPFALGRRRAP